MNRARQNRKKGLRIALAFTFLYTAALVILPLSGVFFKGATIGLTGLWHAIASPRAIASYRLTFGASLGAATVNAILGYPTAWVLARYRFPGKRLLDACVDLPFALPTAVAGITLATLYSEHGWLGEKLARLGIRVSFTPLGIAVALTFVGLPFVIRSLQPVLEEIDPEVEDAATMLGASRWQGFTRVIFPTTWPALLTGFTLSFARALGEYGSVIFIAGNMPMRTEITTLLIVTKLESYDYGGAAAIASVMLLLSFALLLTINSIQAWGERRGMHVG